MWLWVFYKFGSEWTTHCLIAEMGDSNNKLFVKTLIFGNETVLFLVCVCCVYYSRLYKWLNNEKQNGFIVQMIEHHQSRHLWMFVRQDHSIIQIWCLVINAPLIIVFLCAVVAAFYSFCSFFFSLSLLFSYFSKKSLFLLFTKKIICIIDISFVWKSFRILIRKQDSCVY